MKKILLVELAVFTFASVDAQISGTKAGVNLT